MTSSFKRSELVFTARP